VVAVMHDVLTNAEKALARSGCQGEVAEIRQLFQDAMEADFRGAVERLTGRKVIAFVGANHLEPDLATGYSFSTRRPDLRSARLW